MKRIAVISFSCVSMLSAQPCFQSVDGINLWQLNNEIGLCVDAYGESTLELLDSTIDLVDSSIDLLNTVLCSVGNVTEITQSNFAAGITAPGLYKLCESISSVGGSAIPITASDVILDLGGYSLSNINIIIDAVVANVVIKNGTIENAAAPHSNSDSWKHKYHHRKYCY